MLLKFLNELPRKMLLLADHDHAPAFVLHDFCSESYFNLSKAAYFVDNPDFDCTKGIAGVCKHEESFCTIPDIWQERERYCSILDCSPFYKKVRDFNRPSVSKNCNEKECVDIIAHEFDFTEPRYITWPMKHNNHGIFVFQAHDGDQELIDEHLEHGVYYLNFCPLG